MSTRSTSYSLSRGSQAAAAKARRRSVPVPRAHRARPLTAATQNRAVRALAAPPSGMGGSASGMGSASGWQPERVGQRGSTTAAGRNERSRRWSIGRRRVVGRYRIGGCRRTRGERARVRPSGSTGRGPRSATDVSESRGDAGGRRQLLRRRRPGARLHGKVRLRDDQRPVCPTHAAARRCSRSRR